MATREVLGVATNGHEDGVGPLLRSLLRPDAERALADLRKRYAKHATSADAVRGELDRAMDGRLLTEELERVRGA